MILDPLLLNIMNDGLLRPTLSEKTKLKALGDNIKILIVVEYLEEIIHIFNQMMVVI